MMELLIVRHADAGDRDAFADTGRPDSERPLSPKGHTQMRGVASGLLTLVPACDAVVSSPYTRPRETAEYLREAYRVRDVALTETLEPEADPAAFERWERAQPRRDVLVAVGHEPHVSTLAGWLVTGKRKTQLEFKKGAVCLIEFDGRVKRSAGTLRWLKTPKELAALAD